MLKQMAAIILMMFALGWGALICFVAVVNGVYDAEDKLFLAGVLIPCAAAIYLVLSQKLYRNTGFADDD